MISNPTVFFIPIQHISEIHTCLKSELLFVLFLDKKYWVMQPIYLKIGCMKRLKFSQEVGGKGVKT